MFRRDEGGSAPGGSSEEAIALRRSLIIVSSVLGATIIAILAAVAGVVLRRRGRRRRAYDTARARNPYLTRPEYDDNDHRRRRRLRWLTASSPCPNHPDRRGSGGGGVDVEAQRSEMIRKSLQSRSMVNMAGAANQDAPPTPSIPHPFAAAADPAATTESLVVAPKPARTRSRTWHGGRLPNDSDDDNDGGDDENGGRGDRGNGGDDVRSAQARVDYMWQLLNRKGGYPSSSSPLPAAGNDDDDGDGDDGDGDDDDPAPRPPTIRLKTPPLLSHPAFRNWSNAGHSGDGSRPKTPKHSSLPTELMTIRPSPL
ncbi:hypothetical protein RB594_001312 [Gaeumannomyces avenae]